MIKLLPADIILTQTDTWLSKTIRTFDKGPVSHAAMSLYDGEVAEVIWRVIRRPIEEALQKKKYAIFRHKFLSQDEREAIATCMLSIEGQFQGFNGLGKMFLAGLDGVFNSFAFTQKFGITSFKDCSNAAAWSCYQTFKGKLFEDAWRQRFAQDRVFGIGWRSIRPGVIYKSCLELREEWDLLESTLNLS